MGEVGHRGPLHSGGGPGIDVADVRGLPQGHYLCSIDGVALPQENVNGLQPLFRSRNLQHDVGQIFRVEPPPADNALAVLVEGIPLNAYIAVFPAGFPVQGEKGQRDFLHKCPLKPDQGHGILRLLTQDFVQHLYGVGLVRTLEHFPGVGGILGTANRSGVQSKPGLFPGHVVDPEAGGRLPGYAMKVGVHKFLLSGNYENLSVQKVLRFCFFNLGSGGILTAEFRLQGHYNPDRKNVKFTLCGDFLIYVYYICLYTII